MKKNYLDEDIIFNILLQNKILALSTKELAQELDLPIPEMPYNLNMPIYLDIKRLNSLNFSYKNDKFILHTKNYKLNIFSFNEIYLSKKFFKAKIFFFKMQHFAQKYNLLKDTSLFEDAKLHLCDINQNLLILNYLNNQNDILYNNVLTEISYSYLVFLNLNIFIKTKLFYTLYENQPKIYSHTLQNFIILTAQYHYMNAKILKDNFDYKTDTLKKLPILNGIMYNYDQITPAKLNDNILLALYHCHIMQLHYTDLQLLSIPNCKYKSLIWDAFKSYNNYHTSQYITDLLKKIANSNPHINLSFSIISDELITDAKFRLRIVKNHKFILNNKKDNTTYLKLYNEYIQLSYSWKYDTLLRKQEDILETIDLKNNPYMIELLQDKTVNVFFI